MYQLITKEEELRAAIERAERWPKHNGQAYGLDADAVLYPRDLLTFSAAEAYG